MHTHHTAGGIAACGDDGVFLFLGVWFHRALDCASVQNANNVFECHLGRALYVRSHHRSVSGAAQFCTPPVQDASCICRLCACTCYAVLL